MVRLFKGSRFQTRLFLYYSLIVSVIITLALSSFYIYNSKLIEDRARENLVQLASKTSNQLESLVMEMDRIALYVVSNPTISEIFSVIKKNDMSGNHFESSIEENRKVINMLTAISLPNSRSTFRTSLYNIKGDYISMGIPDSSQVVQRKTNAADYLTWYTSLLPGNKRLLLPPHEDFWSDDKNYRFFSIIREIMDMETDISYGVVEVQQSYRNLKELLTPDSASSVQAFVLTAGGELVYPLDQSVDRRLLDVYLEKIGISSGGNLKLKNPLTGKTEIIAFAHSELSNWTLVLCEKEEALLAPVRLLAGILFLTGIGLLSVTLIAVFIMTNRLTQPLKQLRKSIKTINLDNLSISVAHPDSSDEMLQLNEAFNAMFTRLKESMNELIQTRSHEMKAHMIALQSQMDPHFLYNMLSIVSASSRELGAERITDICARLSSMLRYITAYNQDFAPIRDEIEHASNYLKLMKIRYEDQFDYRITVDEDLYKLRIEIPKLTLQPLLENCFQHGFKKVLPPWQLYISVGQSERRWFIEVRDNGMGFEEEKLHQLYGRVDEFIKNPSTNIKDLKLGGMGLINTLVRFRLLYKEDVIIKIENLPGGGTKVTIGGAIQ